MKNFRVLLVALVVLVGCFHSIAAEQNGSDDQLIEDIKAYADSLENALEARNYKAAKDNLDLLFPLIKTEIKLAKKEVKELAKSGAKAQATEAGNALKRKTEIHDRLHAYVDSSSAGLRVKADDIKSLVNEYVDLLEDKDQLVSSNN